MRREVRRARKQRRADTPAGPPRVRRARQRAATGPTTRTPHETTRLVRRRGRGRGLRDGPRPPCRRGAHRRRAAATGSARARASAPGCSRDEVAQGRPRRKPSCASGSASCLMDPRARAGAATGRRRTTRTTRHHRRGRQQLMDTAEIRRRFLAHFERARATPPVPSALAAARRPEPAVRQRRHGAVQAVLPRPGDAAVRPRGERAEVRAHPRHRGRRQDHPARHVLRDVRQLLLRRLLQGGRHRARLGPGHQAAVADGGFGLDESQALPERLRRRPGGGRAVAQGHRPARRPDRAAGQERELLVDGRARPGRPVLGDPLSTAARRTAPTATSAPRTATWSSGTWSSCRTSSARSAARTTSTSPARCRRRTSTPAWASSGSRSCCRARRTCTRST